ncbi:MAG: hypothetical protein H8E39_00475 [Alphaproteobacteria bacterium]|nr:hypothetical protein [Alphaproteobacteria bacterium]
MAFNAKDLSVLAYANGFTLWHYTTTDLSTDVDTSGYLNDATDIVRVGDMILANADTGGTPASGIYLVNANTGGVVDLSDLTSVGGSDLD